MSEHYNGNKMFLWKEAIEIRNKKEFKKTKVKDESKAILIGVRDAAE